MSTVVSDSIEVYLPPTVEVVVTAPDQVVVGVVQGGDIPPIVTSNAGFLATNGASTLGGNRLVTVTSAGVMEYADCTNAAHVGRPVGMSSGAISPFGSSFLLTNGYLDEPSWTWTPGQTLYLGTNGMPVPYASLPGGRIFELTIGAAVTATRIQLNIANTPIVN
jgi:hypothetical protein